MKSPHCFVAFFDVLGMTSLIQRDLSTAWAELNNLWTDHQMVQGLTVNLSKENRRISGRVKSFTFSDTIILYTDYDDDDDAYAMSLLSGELFYRALSYGIPLRGGICHGEFRSDSDRSIFTGPALIDAYRLGESAGWVGVCVDEALASRAKELQIRADARYDIYTDWDVECRNGFETRLVLDWPNFYWTEMGPPPMWSPEDFYERFSRLFGSWNDLDESVRSKYRNTSAFRNRRLAARFPEMAEPES